MPSSVRTPKKPLKAAKAGPVGLSPEAKEAFMKRLIPDLKALGKLSADLKKKGHKVVLTQGVFDLIHEGHAKYLELAKAQGDILIVGIDSDEFTRKRKGPNRPIVPQDERINMLLHLRHVDFVGIREINHGIGDMIRAVKPDVLVTSSSTGDFNDEMKKEYQAVCGEIVTFPPQATTHTSARIRNLTIEGAEKLATEVQKLIQDFLKNIRS